jgi:hypothetical protein
VLQECAPLSQRFQGGKEPQFSSVKGSDQIFQEQAPEQTGQDPDGQEESERAGNPLCAVRRQTATGNDTMQVGMMTPTPTIP